jgi:ATP-dependent helicase HrpB
MLAAGLLSSDHPKLILLQPRRVAARAVASRIAAENGWTLGKKVGYQVRFDRRAGPETRLLVETEGVLNRRLVADPFLDGIGAVVLDEFHERSLHTDLAIALLREVRETVRDDLLLVVMSATLDVGPVVRFLGDCHVVSVDARPFPVEISYRPTAKPGAAESVSEVVREILESEHDQGHVLVFLPGAEEIRRARVLLKPVAEAMDVEMLPLHGALPSDEQDRALRPSRRRKLILATNIAETSLTIDGVRTVIDSGLMRSPSYDPARGLDRLDLCRISKASATQRAGRAGRTATGRCIRLWSEREQQGLPEADLPEVSRLDLTATVLAVHAWGTNDPSRFGWFEPPPADRIELAERSLEMLAAIDRSDRKITALGRQLLSIPAHPRVARLLIAAAALGFARTGATLAAILSEKDIMRQAPREDRSSWVIPRPPEGGRGMSDLLTRLELLEEVLHARCSIRLRDRGIDIAAARSVARARDDLIRVALRLPGAVDSRVGEPDDHLLLKWVLLAYPDRVTRRRGIESTGVMVGGRGVRLEPESVVRDHEFFIAIDPREGRRAGRRQARVRIASAVRLEWIEELFPEFIRRDCAVRYEPERERAVGVSSVWYHDLLLRENLIANVDRAEASHALARWLRPHAAAFVREHTTTAVWLARLDFLRAAMPEFSLPVFCDEICAQILSAACVGKTTLDEVRHMPLLPLLKAHLTHAQQRAIDEHAPESLRVPSGNQIRLSYEPGRPPILAVRLQELFGWSETPRVAAGRVPVLLQLLGPNYRPVQVTDDLRSFWAEAYFQVRKDLRSRYPRHSWPEDPLSAAPEAKGGRRT